MNKYKNMMFFAPDDGGGEGGSGDAGSVAGTGEISRGEQAFEPVAKTTTGDKPLPENKGKSSGPSGAETGALAEGTQDGPTQSGFDASKFAKEFGASLSETLKPVLESRQEPAAKMTPEEAKKLLNVWEPDDQWYARYDNLETRAAAVSEMRDGLVLQADTLNQLRMQEQLTKLREEFAPHFQSIQQAENARRETAFATRFPQLAKPELQPLIKSIANDLVERKQTFKTEAEMFKALANGVEAVIKVNNPEFKLEEAGTTSNGEGEASGRRGNQLPVTTPGGGGGTGRRTDSSSKSNKPRGLEIFSS